MGVIYLRSEFALARSRLIISLRYHNFLLGSIESLLSASVADGMMMSIRHHSDQELVGQGITNMVIPLFGGIPLSGAIARTAVNIRAELEPDCRP